MGEVQVLGSKVRPPVAHRFAVARPAAVALVDQAVDTAGSVVLATPPGYARLDLLLQWAAQRPDEPVLWLRLDRWDHLARLLVHLTAALQGLDPRIGVDALHTVGEGAEAIRDVALPVIARDIEGYGRPFTLVVDGVHRVVDEVAHVGLRAIQRYRPANMRLAWLSDDDTVADFRAVGGASRAPRLTARELRYHPEHVAEMFALAAVDIAPSDVARLTSATDGWPLVLFHVVEQSLTARRAVRYDPADPDLADRLHQAICSPLPADLHGVLSDLAVVGRATVAELEEHTDRGAVMSHIERLQRRHLVRWVDSSVEVVPAAVPHLRLERALHDPTTATVLRRRVAHSLADRGFPGVALELLHDAGDHEAHARLLLERHRQWSSVHRKVVTRAVERALIHSPSMIELHLVRAWFEVFTGDDRAARATIDTLDAHPLTGTRRLRLRSEVEMLEAVLARRSGRMDDCLFHAIGCEELGSALDPADADLLAVPYTAVVPQVVSLYLGHCLFHAGELDDARAELLRANLARTWSAPALAALHGALALIGWLEDDRSASIHATIAGNNVDTITSSNHLGAAAIALVGDDDMAQRYLDAVETVAEPTATVLGHLITAMRSDIAAEARRSHAAARAAAERCTQPGVLSLLVAKAGSRLDIHDGSPELGDVLTDGERRVVLALRGDLTEREIAGELNLSHNTVRTYRRRAYRKLGVVSRAEAVARIEADDP